MPTRHNVHRMMLRTPPEATLARMTQEPGNLTPREREVLALLAAGRTNGEISRELGISFPTAKAHVSSILTKLNAESREAAVAAWQTGPHSRGHRAWMVLAPLTMLGIAAGAVIVVVLVRSVLPGVHSYPDELTVPLSDLEPGMPRHYDIEGLGEDPFGRAYGVWVVLQLDGEVDAFLDRDPHTGCTLPWDADYPLDFGVDQFLGHEPGAFKANCGGWVFLKTGEIVFGASPRGLDGFAVDIDGSLARVDLTRVRLGTCRDQTVPLACSSATGPVFMPAPPPAIIPDYGTRVTRTTLAGSSD